MMTGSVIQFDQVRLGRIRRTSPGSSRSADGIAANRSPITAATVRSATRPAPGATTIPALPGETARMPEGARIVAKNRATGSYARAGYLPPCSGGRGNLYFADVIALDTKGDVLAKGRIILGRY